MTYYYYPQQSVLRRTIKLRTNVSEYHQHQLSSRSSPAAPILNLLNARPYSRRRSSGRGGWLLSERPLNRSSTGLVRLDRQSQSQAVLTPSSSHFSSSTLQSFSPSSPSLDRQPTHRAMISSSSSSDPWKNHVDISFQELKPITEMPSDDILLIDVREESEVIEGNIPSSVNIPISKFEKAIDLHPDDFLKTFGFPKPTHPNQKIILYCRAGSRSAKALEIAKLKGYKNLRNYRGSWLDWIEHQKAS